MGHDECALNDVVFCLDWSMSILKWLSSGISHLVSVAESAPVNVQLGRKIRFGAGKQHRGYMLSGKIGKSSTLHPALLNGLHA